MCWITKSQSLFKIERPVHFVEPPHCYESAEHEQTLQQFDIRSVGIEQLGNPGWDPMCFCSVEGKKYYMPALIRLCIETIDDDHYFDQFLFHISYEEEKNELFLNCSEEQRIFIANFIESMIESYPKEIERELTTDEALKAYEIWSNT